MIRLLGFTFLYAVGIFILHSAPVGQSGLRGFEIGWFEASDLVHVSMFIPWGFLGFFFVTCQSGGEFWRGSWWVVFGLLLGMGAEGIQYWIPGRSFSPSDLSLNFLGVLLGSLAMLGWRIRIGMAPVLTRSSTR